MSRSIDRELLERRLREEARAATLVPRASMRESVLARLDERRAPEDVEPARAPRRLSRAWLAAAGILAAATIAWALLARSTHEGERAPAPITVENQPPRRGADGGSARTERKAPRWESLVGALGRTSKRALALSSEVSELESDSRAAVRFLLGRVRLGPPPPSGS